MNTIVLLSGGIDSAVVLARTVAEHGKQAVAALTVSYGASHNQAERERARLLAAHYHVLQRSTSVPFIGKYCGGSLVRGGSLEGAATIVPLRNAVLCALAASWAASLGAVSVLLGATLTDAAVYPDCRGRFIDDIDAACYAGSGNQVRIRAPFLFHTKTHVVQVGAALQVPWDLTYSCYVGEKELQCGMCGACQERRRAFTEAGIVDPVPMRAGGETNFTRAAPVGRVGESRDESAEGQTGSPVAPGRTLA